MRSATVVCAGARPRVVAVDLPVVRVERPVAAFAPAPVPRARRAGVLLSGWVPDFGVAVVLVSEIGPRVASATFAVVAFFATVVRTAFGSYQPAGDLTAADLGHGALPLLAQALVIRRITRRSRGYVRRDSPTTAIDGA
jgi:hypothetical protein